MHEPVRIGEHLAYVSEAMRVTHDTMCRRSAKHRGSSVT